MLSLTPENGWSSIGKDEDDNNYYLSLGEMSNIKQIEAWVLCVPKVGGKTYLELQEFLGNAASQKDLKYVKQLMRFDFFNYTFIVCNLIIKSGDDNTLFSVDLARESKHIYTDPIALKIAQELRTEIDRRKIRKKVEQAELDRRIKYSKPETKEDGLLDVLGDEISEVIEDGIRAAKSEQRTYKIFKHPSGAIEAVKQGWSWPACFFTSIWAVSKKMWARGIILFVILVFLNIALNYLIGDRDSNFVQIGLAIVISWWFGADGNEWREDNLKSRGYEYKTNTLAKTSEGAIALFLKAQQ